MSIIPGHPPKSVRKSTPSETLGAPLYANPKFTQERGVFYVVYAANYRQVAEVNSLEAMEAVVRLMAL